MAGLNISFDNGPYAIMVVTTKALMLACLQVRQVFLEVVDQL